ncbi:MAG: DsbA family protein, partial [Lactobacillus sp.]|nr:DsbA family protein [Lactobacillus sp.]
MKIEIWSDYVCPFCYIGKKQLEKAIEDTGYSGQVELVYKSYQLDPTTPIDSHSTVY